MLKARIIKMMGVNDGRKIDYGGQQSGYAAMLQEKEMQKAFQRTSMSPSWMKFKIKGPETESPGNLPNVKSIQMFKSPFGNKMNESFTQNLGKSFV